MEVRAMPLKNIERRNVSDMVYEQFMDALRSGEWRAGEKIPSENELASALNVSRMSIRTALQRLSALGLIESRQGDGTFVCEFTGAQYANSLVPITLTGSAQMEHLMEFRKILDCEIAALAAQKADEATVEALRENYRKHKELAHDLEGSAEMDAEFHFMLAKATQNPLIIQVYTVFMKVFEMNMREIVRKMGSSGAMKFHREIIDAIAEKDASAARKIMAAHIEDTIHEMICEKTAK